MTSSIPERIARGMMFLFFLCAFFSDFFASNPPDQQNLTKFYAPPTRIHLFDSEGQFHWRPFIYDYELLDPLDAAYRERTDTIIPLSFFCEGYDYKLLGLIPFNFHLVGCGEGSTFYALGSDSLGRDILARVLTAARTSFLVIVIGVSIYAIIGLAFGTISGIAGGWIDSLLMRFADFVLALPALYLMLALRALLPPELPFYQALILTSTTIALVSWPPLARGIRGLIKQVRNAVFVEAARSMGGTHWHIFRRHMLPAITPVVLNQLLVAAPMFLLGEVILSFLNVGMGESGISWGLMMQALKDPRVMTTFWWNLAPLGFVFLTLLCFNIFAGSFHPKDQTKISL